jgi:5-methylcytosine-specific restriction endonuclease McrA
VPIRPENRDRYPADWREIRAAIIDRARPFPGAMPQCECRGECGRGTHTGRCPNVYELSAYGTGSRVVLTVAHLDHAPEHNDPANLRAMCQGCHLHYDREHHAQTRAVTRRRELAAAGQLALDGVP